MITKRTILTLGSASITLLGSFSICSNLPTTAAVNGQYRGIKLPYRAGQSREVTGTHNRAQGRRAIDFGMYKEDVLAIKGGVVRSATQDQYGGKYLLIDHGDNYCSIYLHLESFNVSFGQTVQQGQVIAKSGNTGLGRAYHLHLAVIQKLNGNCTANSSREIAMIFDEKPGGEIILKDKIVSQNRTTSNDTTFKNPGVSSLATITQQSVNLRVCASNLQGKTVYVRMYRDAVNGFRAKEWRNQSKVAPDTCVDFTNLDDLDNVGPTFSGVWYYTVASLTPIPDGEAAKKRTQCWSATGGKYLCDAVRR
ncbi:M23 family metallopeptidase [Coleofasciculus sp. FACHB-129]|uniref:M23 family metallopeptidase n=1 Tax=Cyanophyceae TaxID=3028117 RepID=UPI0016890C0A|nr:M23 family metallopeptidase [Coleofasciculus sp. FACHB-129]MBD1896599.1 M23 family metallopeptidase [Coleofasciculus sp. FACHB-129]